VFASNDWNLTNALKNPNNDAALISDKLRELGFDVQFEKDVGARGFSEIIEGFSRKLDKDSEVLFYYAGHGLQFRGENLLVGVDARLSGEATLRYETFPLNTILNLLEQRVRTTLLFWDACRDNPLADELMRSIPASGSSAVSQLVRGGAAALPPRRGDTLIVFSAEPGKKALDGTGTFSPFAESLGRHIGTTNVEIESMLKRVAAEVLERTNHFQRPERLSQLTRDFYFRGEGQNAAYEDEVRRLSAKIAELQREPLARKRFTIVGSDDGAPKSIISAPPAPQSLPTRGASPLSDASQMAGDTSTSPPEPQSAVARSVVIAVERAASTVIRKLRVSPNGKLLALGDEEGFIRVVRLETLEVVTTFRAHSGRISDLDFKPDSRILLSAGRDGSIRFWDLENLRENTRPVKELKAPRSIPYSARINPDFSALVLMGDREGRLVAWDTRRDHIITNAKFHHGPVLSVAYQPAGKGTFLSGGGDGQLNIRLPEGKRLSIHPHNGPMFQASYSATGRHVYTVGADRIVKLWDAAQFDQQHPRPQTIMSGHLKYVLTADMSQDEKLLASGGGDKGLNLWDAASGRLVGRMQGHTSDIEAIAFFPNGRFIASTSEDKSVRIWSVDNHEELARLYFQKNGEKYVGVTFDNQIFGERNSGLVSVYVDDREVSPSDADAIVKYIGRGIAIIENGN
jgi:WD40 repeat protein